MRQRLATRSISGKVLCGGIGMAVCLMMTCGATAEELQFSDNLLANGDFEEGTAQWAVSRMFAPATTEVVKGDAPEAVHGGEQALRIGNAGGWSHLYHSRRTAASETIHELTFWARAGEPVLDAEGQPIEPGVSVTTYIYGNSERPGPTVYIAKKVRLRPKAVGNEWRRFVVRFWEEPFWHNREMAVALGIRGDVTIDDVDLRILESKVDMAPDRVMQSRHNSERIDSSHVNRIETRLETPHLRFGRPSAAGPIKTLFFVPIQGSAGTRDVVEMAQRFDLTFTNYTLWHPGTFAWVDVNQYGAFDGVSLAEKTAEALERLDEGAEVIVLGSVVFSSMPGPVQSRIIQRVKDGAGLVVTSPRNLAAELHPQAIPEARDRILTGVPLTGLPEFFPASELSGEQRAANSVNAFEVGDGRVVVIKWSMDKPVEGSGVAPAPAGRPWTKSDRRYKYLSPHRPLRPGRWTRQYEHRYNYHLSLVAKAIQWAAKRELRAQWTNLPADGQRIPRADLPVNDLGVEVTWSGEAQQDATLTVTVRDPLGHVESKVESAHALAPGANPLPVALPQLKCGLHFLDLMLTAKDGVENWATVALQIEGPERIVELTTEQEYYERGQTVRGTVKFDGAIPEATQLVVSARDTNDRVYNRTTVQVPAGATEMPIEIAVDRPTTLATYVEAELVRDGEVLSFADAIVFVPKRDFKGFLSVLWAGVWNEGIGQVALRQARQAGFNAVYHWAYSVGDFENAAMMDMLPTQYACHLTLRPDERGWGVGLPAHGRLDPKFREWVNNTFLEELKASVPLGPPYYSLGDEDHFAYGIGYSPYELQAYRQFLTDRYETIDRLNEAYGSQYESFEDVPRYKEPEAIGKGLIPALIDHRLGTDDEWANLHHDLAREVKKLDPNAHVGAEGSQAGNIEKMTEGVNFWAPYAGSRQKKVLKRSFMRPDHVTSHWWGGTDTGHPDCTWLWEWLMNDFVNFNQWFCAQHLDGAMFRADYSFREYFENLLPGILELHNGPALLLRDAHVVSDGPIAIHFSRESEHASIVLNQLTTKKNAEQSVIQILNVLGRDYRYISSKQIVAGRLEAPRARILFLPYTLTLSKKAADGIRDFVNRGGMVVADFLPALDEFGRRLPQGRLDALFGATCAGETSPRTVGNIAVDTEINGQVIKLNCPQTVVDAALKATDAEPLARAQRTPLMLVNSHGRGKTVLINFDLFRCPYSEQVGFGAALLRAAGATPQYKLDGPPSSLLSVQKRGSMALFGLILPRLDPQNPRQDATITWAEPMHVYDVRAGRYLGHRNEVSITVSRKPRREHLFILQPLPLTALELKAPENIGRGQSLTLKVNLNFGGAGPPEVDRVVRIELANPDGQKVLHYRDFPRITATEGELQIPFAYNDSPGKWTITATDIATGVSATRTVTLRK